MLKVAVIALALLVLKVAFCQEMVIIDDDDKDIKWLEMEVDPSDTTRVAVNITFEMEFTYKVAIGVNITVLLPRFTNGDPSSSTPGSNIGMGSLYVSPSRLVEGQWVEGSLGSFSDPHSESKVVFRFLEEVDENELISLSILPQAGVKAYCGIGPNWESITLSTTSPLANTSSTTFDTVSQVGSGCAGEKRWYVVIEN